MLHRIIMPLLPFHLDFVLVPKEWAADYKSKLGARAVAPVQRPHAAGSLDTGFKSRGPPKKLRNALRSSPDAVITHALPIREPWISMILDGKKT